MQHNAFRALLFIYGLLMGCGETLDPSPSLEQTTKQLFAAVDRGDAASLADLLAAGGDPNARNDHGDTLLIWASHHQHQAVVEDLLQAGADPNLRGGMGRTALHWAAQRGNAAVTQRLLAADAATALFDQADDTPLMVAAKQGYGDVATVLLAAGADPDLADSKGYTALMLALYHRQAGAVESLIAAGADLQLATHRGQTAVDIALQRDAQRLLRDPAVVQLQPHIDTLLASRTATREVNLDQRPAYDWAQVAQHIHTLTNQARQQHGLSTLAYDEELARIAARHSRDMAARQFFDHVNPDGQSPTDRAVAMGYPVRRELGNGMIRTGIAENIYQGYLMSGSTSVVQGGERRVRHRWLDGEAIAALAVEGWMNSPGHRENILTADHLAEGIGIAIGADYAVYITQNFR